MVEQRGSPSLSENTYVAANSHEQVSGCVVLSKLLPGQERGQKVLKEVSDGCACVRNKGVVVHLAAK